jgi:hypothetical protein
MVVTDILLILGIPFILVILKASYRIYINRKDYENRPMTFLENEAERVWFDHARKSSGWNSRGRSFTRGIAMITDKDGKRKLISQSKLVDGGIAF